MLCITANPNGMSAVPVQKVQAALPPSGETVAEQRECFRE